MKRMLVLISSLQFRPDPTDFSKKPLSKSCSEMKVGIKIHSLEFPKGSQCDVSW